MGYICSEKVCGTNIKCGKTFGRQGDLNRHRLLHTGIRAHKCDFCPKAFSQRSGLKTHMNIHTKARPFRCGLGSCTSAFSDPSSAARHRKEIHSGNRTYHCPAKACGTSIKRRSAFVAHLKKHGFDMAALDVEDFTVAPGPSSELLQISRTFERSTRPAAESLAAPKHGFVELPSSDFSDAPLYSMSPMTSLAGSPSVSPAHSFENSPPYMPSPLYEMHPSNSDVTLAHHSQGGKYVYRPGSGWEPCYSRPGSASSLFDGSNLYASPNKDHDLRVAHNPSSSNGTPSSQSSALATPVQFGDIQYIMVAPDQYSHSAETSSFFWPGAMPASTANDTYHLGPLSCEFDYLPTVTSNRPSTQETFSNNFGQDWM
ncbi:hypothetical protein PLICRDRAFT_198722 [Plicaturopsis crispa FD-325 SS-3]|nr:hypothetical protein PLICRDRAFT_198722 [Plicaturopsis crispa FD-325 SS-3]